MKKINPSVIIAILAVLLVGVSAALVAKTMEHPQKPAAIFPPANINSDSNANAPANADANNNGIIDCKGDINPSDLELDGLKPKID